MLVPIDCDSSTTRVIGPPHRLLAATNDGDPSMLVDADLLAGRAASRDADLVATAAGTLDRTATVDR